MPMGGGFKQVSSDPARLSSPLGVCRTQIRPILPGRLAGLESACRPAVLDSKYTTYERGFQAGQL